MGIKTLFFGSPEFAKNILETLFSLEYVDIIGVVTNPDKEFGRKKELKPTPVKEFVKLKYPNIKVFEAKKLASESFDILNETKPELIVVASYGKILPDTIINYPKYKCLNIHGSLLPILRGAVPVQTAILKGFNTTGVSVQIMRQEMDEGDVIFFKEVEIEGNDTTESLMIKLAKVGTDLLRENLIEYINGGIDPVKQDETEATYCFISDFSYEKALIDWKQSTVDIDRKIRAFYPDPICYTKELTIKEIEGKECNIKFSGNTRIYSGTINDTDKIDVKVNPGDGIIKNGKLLIKTSDSFISILKLQLEGRNIVSSSDFINGLKNRI